MKSKHIIAVMAPLLAWGVTQPGHAQGLASRSFDILFQGDDPTERYDSRLPPEPLVPVTVRFDRFFENLNSEETGVRDGIGWLSRDNMWHGTPLMDEWDLRLPGEDALWGTTRAPFQFEHRIDFTPSETSFWGEGLGGSDRFRFVGDFVIEAVPEPTALTPFGGAGLIGRHAWRWRRNHTSPRSD